METIEIFYLIALTILVFYSSFFVISHVKFEKRIKNELYEIGFKVNELSNKISKEVPKKPDLKTNKEVKYCHVGFKNGDKISFYFTDVISKEELLIFDCVNETCNYERRIVRWEINFINYFDSIEDYVYSLPITPDTK